MNKLIPSALLALAMLSPAAQADTGGALATGVGQWIAAQGNAALRDMREEFRRDLKERLQPLTPKPARDENRGRGKSA